jgi:cytochrome c oxidase subunit 2
MFNLTSKVFNFNFPATFGWQFFDLAEPYQLSFQDSATDIMEGILNLHNIILYYLIIVVIFVSWVLISLFTKNHFSHSNLNHGTLIEIIWTITPALILINIALPSFKLLYMMDEVIDPIITIKTIGHQWYWEYEYSDYSTPSIKFDSYMVPTDSLNTGNIRLLEVDNRLILPSKTNIRIIVTATDVIHSFAVPSLGIKVDAMPGRLNQTPLFIKRNGVFYGQCSEICGVQHGFMPIVIESVDMKNYLNWLLTYENS